MVEGLWHIIPIDPTEAMSTYSAILFIVLFGICLYLYIQNKELECELDKKEKKLAENFEKSLVEYKSELSKINTNQIELGKDMSKVCEGIKSLGTGLSELRKDMRIKK